MSTEPTPEATVALDHGPARIIRETVESLYSKIQAELDCWKRHTPPPVLVHRELLLEYAALPCPRSRTEPTSSKEWDKVLDLVHDIAGLLSSRELLEGPNKKAVELIFGCLSVILWLGPCLAKQTERKLSMLHGYTVALAFYLNRYDYLCAKSTAEQVNIALAYLLRLGAHVTIFYLSKERNIRDYRECLLISVSSTQQDNDPDSFDHEEAKRLLESMNDSRFEDLMTAITQSTTTLQTELEDPDHASLISGITNQQFSDFVRKHEHEHPSRSGTLHSAVALTRSFSLLENATAQAIKQAARLFLACFQLLFQLRHCEDCFLEDAFDRFHKYGLALSNNSTAIFEDSQKLSDALIERIKLSVGSVVFWYKASKFLRMDRVARASIMKSGIQHLNDTAILLCVFESKKKLRQKNLEPENTPKPFVPKVTASYELRDLPGYGIVAFATQDIARGTRVMDEFPLLSIEVKKKFATPFDIWNRLNDEPADRQEGFRALFRSNKNLDKARREITRLTEGLEVKESSIDLEDVALVAAIWHTNAFGSLAQHIKHAVYEDQSRLNHMCMFNTMQMSMPDGSQHMLAMRDIEEGEQLTCPYIETRGSYQDRQGDLEHWGFTCTCPLCEMELYVDKTPNLKIEETVPGLDQQGLTDMIVFMRIWFDAIQIDADEDWHRRAAEKNGIELKNVGLMFERAFLLLEHMSKEEKDSSSAAAKLIEVNKTTMKNILADLKKRPVYWRE